MLFSSSFPLHNCPEEKSSFLACFQHFVRLSLPHAWKCRGKLPHSLAEQIKALCGTMGLTTILNAKEEEGRTLFVFLCSPKKGEDRTTKHACISCSPLPKKIVEMFPVYWGNLHHPSLSPKSPLGSFPCFVLPHTQTANPSKLSAPFVLFEIL